MNTGVSWRSSVAIGAWLAIATACALLEPVLPRSEGVSGEFSAARAMESVRWIAWEPHPVGTAAHAEVGRRLERAFAHLGLAAQTQQATFADSRPGNRLRLVHVRNVLAKRAGTRPTGTVLLMAHYDSAIGAPGAADDGAGVAVLLETARLLASEPPRRNDVVFAATDAEEAGLCGARVFLREHAWSRGIGAVINFEARGVRGPSILFETGERDGWLVREFATAVPAPYGNSLAPALYEHMPNATDLTVLRGSGVPRLNFAFADGWQSYHTPHDAAAAVDPDSLRHQGSNAVALARRLADVDLRRAAEDTSRLVYFNVGSTVLRYDARAAVPLGLAVLAFCGWLVWRRRFDGRPGRDAILGVAGALIVVLVTIGAARATWTAVLSLVSDRRAFWDRAGVPLAGILILTGVVLFALHRVLRRAVSADGVALGAMILFAIAGVCAAVWLPGASYVFAWPPVAAAAATWGCREAGRQASFRVPHVLAVAAGSLVVLLVLVPTMRMTYLALPTDVWFVPVIAFTFLLLMPCVEPLARRASWPLLAGSLCVAAALLAWSVVRANRATPVRAPGPGIYLDLAELSHAAWLTRDAAFEAAGLKPVGQSELASIAGVVPTWYGESLRRGAQHMFEAPRLSLAGPTVAIIEDVVAGETRTLGLTLASSRAAPEIGACVRSTGGVLAVRNGAHGLEMKPRAAVAAAGSTAAPDACDVVITALGDPATALPVTVDIPASASLDIQVIDLSYDVSGIDQWSAAHVPPAVAQSGGALVMTRRFRWSSPERVIPKPTAGTAGVRTDPQSR